MNAACLVYGELQINAMKNKERGKRARNRQGNREIAIEKDEKEVFIGMLGKS